MELKTYVIMLSKSFPSTHPNAGNGTFFVEQLYAGIYKTKIAGEFHKIHTIRANTLLWQQRIEKVQAGKAILSVRQWSGKPYCSKQMPVANFTGDSGIGCQILRFRDGDINQPIIEDTGYIPTLQELATNDGLSLYDWLEWFKNYDLNKPLVIIHFTPFRYGINPVQVIVNIFD